MICPDLRPHFAHLHWRPMAHAYGVEVASDWADKAEDDQVFGLYKKCGFWTRDEAAILYHAASQVGGDWVDIGSHTGWTTAHILEGLYRRGHVVAVDTMYSNQEFGGRAIANLVSYHPSLVELTHYGISLVCETSARFFASVAQNSPEASFSGVVIDGDHDDPTPTTDVAQAVCRLKREAGVIIFHDARGGPVKKAVRWLLNYFPEFKHQVYQTPHGVVVCWRGEFDPPEYEQLPGVPEYEI